MVLTPAPPARAFSVGLYLLALLAGGAGLLLVRLALAPGEGPSGERPFFAVLAGTLLAFAVLMVAAAEWGRRGLLVWHAESGRLVGRRLATGEVVALPVEGPARIETERRRVAEGVWVELYSVWVPSPGLGPVRLWAGSGERVEDVRRRWEEARFTALHASLSRRPPDDSGIELTEDGSAYRVPAGPGWVGGLFLVSALLFLAPLAACGLLLLEGAGRSLTLAACVGGGLVALYLALRCRVWWELQVRPGDAQARMRVPGLPPGAWKRMPGDLRLDLSRFPRVTWVDSTGLPQLRARAVTEQPSLSGVIWLTASLRKAMGVEDAKNAGA